jgi:putative ABC transport system substrate-binding protein
MRRREFMTLLGGTVMWPLIASAQQVARMPRVIQLAPADVPEQVEATRAGLRELGYVEGRIVLSFRTRQAMSMRSRHSRRK